MTARNICFTLNNYDDDDIKFLQEELPCSYLVFGRETGVKGTPHLQGYVEFANSKPLAWIRKQLKGAHCEKRLGSASEAAAYCKKDKNFEERGEMKCQGKRNDLDDIKVLIDKGGGLLNIAEENFGAFVRYHKSFELYRTLKLEQDRSVFHPPSVVWCYGGAGSGKTRYAIEFDPRCYIKDGTMWWNGYRQQNVIIIDDFDGKWPYRDLLRLLDRYPYQGQVKGGYVKINSPHIFITCEFPPSHFWKGSNELEQVTRRIELLLYFELGKEAPTEILNKKAEVPGNNWPARTEEDFIFCNFRG